MRFVSRWYYKEAWFVRGRRVFRVSYSRVAVVVSDTSTSGELGVLAVTDVLGASVVGGQGEGRGGD